MKSKARDHRNCALALACKRQEHADAAIISVRTAYVVKGDTAYRYRVPESISREVISFDRAGGFDPGEYHLIPHGPKDRIGRFVSGGPSTGRKRPFLRHVTENIRTALS